jgi:hypothetical protein
MSAKHEYGFQHGSDEIYTIQLSKQSHSALLSLALLTSLGFFTSMEKEISRPEGKTKQG